MNKKTLLGIILVLTIIIIIIIFAFRLKIKYNTLVVSQDTWNNIINTRSISNDIYFESIEFNDYNLIIDNTNSIIYYSVIDTNNKYNPSIKYSINKKTNIAINKEITDNSLEKTDDIKIILYNDKEYHIYSLVVTKYPTLNITYKENPDNKKKIDIDIDIFDNNINNSQHLTKSLGKLRIIEEDNLYSISLLKESLGNNKRENNISLFGMEQRDEYILKKTNKNQENSIRLFINNKYSGIYSFEIKERKIKNYERNKENNK